MIALAEAAVILKGDQTQFDAALADVKRKVESVNRMAATVRMRAVDPMQAQAGRFGGGVADPMQLQAAAGAHAVHLKNVEAAMVRMRGNVRHTMEETKSDIIDRMNAAGSIAGKRLGDGLSQGMSMGVGTAIKQARLALAAAGLFVLVNIAKAAPGLARVARGEEGLGDALKGSNPLGIGDVIRAGEQTGREAVNGPDALVARREQARKDINQMRENDRENAQKQRDARLEEHKAGREATLDEGLADRRRLIDQRAHEAKSMALERGDLDPEVQAAKAKYSAIEVALADHNMRMGELTRDLQQRRLDDPNRPEVAGEWQKQRNFIQELEVAKVASAVDIADEEQKIRLDKRKEFEKFVDKAKDFGRDVLQFGGGAAGELGRVGKIVGKEMIGGLIERDKPFQSQRGGAGDFASLLQKAIVDRERPSEKEAKEQRGKMVEHLIAMVKGIGDVEKKLGPAVFGG